jgi:hypothetical protein
VKSRLKVLIFLCVGVVSLASAPSAAAVVTIGNTAEPTAGGSNTQPVQFVNVGLGPLGGTLNSPVDGAIIRWRVAGFEGPWRLRVMTPNGGPSYTAAAATATESVPDVSPHTYAADLPIKAGQTIGIESTGPAWLGATLAIGASYAFIVPPLGEGATGNGTIYENLSFTFSAEVLPPPTVAAISPAAGTILGGTGISIAGGNFAEVRGVSFGGVPAASFTVLDEGRIDAIAPASATIGSVPVTVTTAAGSASSSQSFSYQGCAVPKLKGKRLKGAKRAVRRQGCLVGKVRKRKGVATKTGRVVKQKPKAGQTLPPGTKVNVKLG